MLAEKGQRALPRELGCCRLIALALVAVEAVLRVVDEDLRLGVVLGELTDAGDRDSRIALAKMTHDGTLRLFLARVGNAAAVIRHRAGKAGQSRGAHPGDVSAPAITDDADATSLRHGVAPRGHVQKRELGGRLGLELASLCSIRRRVPDLEIALIAIEQRRRDGDVAVLREAVADAAHMAVHAEDLLHDDDRAAYLRLALRPGTISRYSETVGCRCLKPLSHRSLLRTLVRIDALGVIMPRAPRPLCTGMPRPLCTGMPRPLWDNSRRCARSSTGSREARDDEAAGAGDAGPQDSAGAGRGSLARGIGTNAAPGCGGAAVPHLGLPGRLEEAHQWCDLHAADQQHGHLQEHRGLQPLRAPHAAFL